MVFPAEILEASRNVQIIARDKSYLISSAESCTGGLLMAALTEIPGASSIIWQGYITYHNDSKQNLLGVRAETLAQDGAVSSQCACEMAQGVLQAMLKLTHPSEQKFTPLALAITGIAGDNHHADNYQKNSSDMPFEKLPGLVYIALAAQDSCHAQKYLFAGSRHNVRIQSVLAALQIAQQYLVSV